MKGIMFKEELFKKIIAGEKTETRRVIKPVPSHFEISGTYNHDGIFLWGDEHSNVQDAKPRYNAGEVVYLKEPYFDNNGTLLYAFDILKEDRTGLKWKNKMFMPARAARYHIKITAVEAERVQDITMKAVINEGCSIPTVTHKVTWDKDWQKLWNSINKPPYAWKDNPWAWVYKFELHEMESHSKK